MKHALIVGGTNMQEDVHCGYLKMAIMSRPLREIQIK